MLQTVEKTLSRTKRFVGLLIAGITALITLIASATASAISLTTSIQTADYVNNLAYNVTQALQTQENWDKKIEQRVNALYDVVQILGDEIVSLEVKSSLRCHAAFSWICITPKEYNDSKFP